MNVKQFFNMLTRRISNRLVGWGIRRAHAPKPGMQQTPQQRQREKATRNATKRARQAARITRRLGR